MWPAWDQDEDPPHVLVMLRANDGSPPLTLRILDKDPDPSAGSDVVDMSLEWATYNPSIPPPPAEAPSGLEPIDIRKDGKEEPVALEYRTEKSNSLKLVLSGETEELGDHVGFKKLYVPSGTPGEKSENAFSHDVLTSDKLKGLVIYENVRLEVRVVARDNRWRRVGPSGSGASLYSSDPIEEARQIFPEDPRAVPDGRGEAKPPYLDTIAREDNMDRGKPGISWWIEEGRKGASADDDLKPARPSFENAPHILFRAPNFPKDDSKGDDDPRNFDRYLRIVVRDLLSNVVDLRIPVLVMPKNFSVDTLESNTSRKSFGKKDS